MSNRCKMVQAASFPLAAASRSPARLSHSDSVTIIAH